MKKIPELLSPAGNLEKLETAIEFGADAVYFGLPDFSLRARINQFQKEEIKKGAKICRKKGKKFYVTLNIYAHNYHFKKLPEHLEFLKEIQPDGLILSDPGILRRVKEELPEISIHLSTQANATNAEAVKFWKNQGVERTILARELSLNEIAEIKKEVPGMELECFIHGAMCMAYSGRCILSKWMTGRSANLGDCSQPCRWKYSPLREKTQYFTDDKKRFEMKVEEDDSGTYIFNSYDINLIEYLPEIAKAGVDSLKIEGRGKSSYYVGCVTRSYRRVLDALKSGDEKEIKKTIQEEKAELEKLSHRGYWTGFLLGDKPPHLENKASNEAGFLYAGISLRDENSSSRDVFAHNFLKQDDDVEIVTPDKIIQRKVVEIKDENGEKIKSAHGGAGKIFKIKFSGKVDGPMLVRKRVKL
ncbi:MAG: U32 family peptidase C-terminal domain-containing protein [Candidatus Moraniibacteriota bacterium]